MTGSPSDIVLAVLFIVFPILALVFFGLWLKCRSKLKQLQNRFSAVIDIDTEIQKAQSELERIDAQINSLQ